MGGLAKLFPHSSEHQWDMLYGCSREHTNLIEFSRDDVAGIDVLPGMIYLPLIYTIKLRAN